MEMMGRFQINFMALISDLRVCSFPVFWEGHLLSWASEASILGRIDSTRLSISAGMFSVSCLLRGELIL